VPDAQRTVVKPLVFRDPKNSRHLTATAISFET